VKILNKNSLPYSIRVLFAPGVVILSTELDLSDCFEFRLLRIFTFNYFHGYLVENPI